MKKTSSLIPLLLVCLLYPSISTFSQKVIDSVARKNLDSIYDLYKGKYDVNAYRNHHRILKKSIELSYKIRMYEAYKSLAWYYGHSTEKNLDSALYYFNQYEKNIKTKEVDFVEDSEMSQRSIFGHYMNKGVILANKFGLLDEALGSYFNAYEYIDDQDINVMVLYDIYLSQIHKIKDRYDKAIEILEPHLKDTSALLPVYKMYLMQNLAANYKASEIPNQSFILNKSILENAKKEKNEYYIWWTKNEMSNDYFLFGKVRKAIDTALMVRSYYKKNINEDALFNNSDYLGDFYYKLGNLDSAIFYKKDAIKYPYSLDKLPKIYGKLASYYQAKGDYETAMEYYKKKDISNDSIRNNEKNVLTTYNDAVLKLLEEKKSKEQILQKKIALEAKNNKQQIFIQILLIFSVLSLLCVVGIKLYLHRKKTGNITSKREVKEKEVLEEHLRLRKNQLDASNSVIKENVEVLKTIEKELDKAKGSNAKVLEVKETISDLITTNSSDIAIISDRIESKYPEITLKLKIKHPELSDREIRYCLLTKLNLTIKETASILHVTPNTVKATRSRLKKKLNVPKDQSFRDYLNEIEFCGN